MRKKRFNFIAAASAIASGNLISGLAFQLPPLVDGKLPSDFQMFPPGTQTINALKNGKPAAVRVTVNAQAAEAIKKDFADMILASEQRKGPKPYIDFNHDDKEASGWITEVFWAGDHPETGGIRAKVEWSEPGSRAILGKSYRQFSPNFRVHASSGDIIGTTANMGGLVNRPAFLNQDPFFAKASDGDGKTTKPQEKMNRLTQALVAAGLLSAVTEDDANAVIDFTQRWSPISAKLTRADTADKMATDQAAKITALEKENAEIKAKHATMAEAHADTVVAKWVGLGILSAKDEVAKKLWKDRIVANPADAMLMDGVISAKGTAAPGTDITKPVIVQGAGAGTQSGTVTAKDGECQEFLVRCKAVASEKKIKDSEAMILVAREEPKLYDAYRESLLYRPSAK